jgi:hypothetical protein
VLAVAVVLAVVVVAATLAATGNRDSNVPVALYVIGNGDVAPRLTITLGTMSRELALCATWAMSPKAEEVLSVETLGINAVALVINGRHHHG